MPVRLAALLERRAALIAAALIGLMLAAGALYSLSLGERLRFLPDEQDYLILADSLAAGHGYSLDGSTPSAYRPPGYPAVLAPFRRLGVGVAGLRWLNFIFFSLTLWLIFHLLRRRRSALAALLALGMALLYPLNFFTAGTLYPQSFSGLLLIASLVVMGGERLSSGRAFLGGLLLGALTLTTPTFIVSAGVFLLWQVWRRRVFQAALALAGLVLLLGAWTARNTLAMRAWFFVSTNSGENLLLGNSENTTPNGGRTVDISRYEAVGDTMSEVERDRYYRQEALRFIAAHPAQTAKMYLLKTLNYFHFRNELVTSSEESRLKDLAMLVSYLPLLFLAGLRIALARRLPLTPEEVLWMALYFSSALATAVFFPRIRFRQPYDALLAILAAPLLARWLGGERGVREVGIDHRTGRA